MKRSVIVVGSHFAGKSKTINMHLKPKLGIGKREHKFSRNGKNGFILSQSFEEANRDVDYVISRYSHCRLLVLSARPSNEMPSYLVEAKSKLKRAGYRVSTVDIIPQQADDYYERTADDIIYYLDH